MILRKLRPIGLLAFALTLLGCSDSGRDTPPNTVVRAVNVAVNQPPLTFRRAHEVQPQYDLAYGGSMQASWNEDTYNFYVLARSLTAAIPNELLTFSKHVVAGTSYMFVLLESAGTVVADTIETSPRLGTETDSQVTAFHAV